LDPVLVEILHTQDDGLAVHGSSTLLGDQNVKILVVRDTMVFDHSAKFDCTDQLDILVRLWLCTFHQVHAQQVGTESLTNLRIQIAANNHQLFYTIC